LAKEKKANKIGSLPLVSFFFDRVEDFFFKGYEQLVRDFRRRSELPDVEKIVLGKGGHLNRSHSNAKDVGI
jgi:hypothetical protein